MTPWQLSVCVRASMQKRQTDQEFYRWAIWHIAAMPKMKDFPKFEKFVLQGKKAIKRFNETAMMEHLKAHSARRAAENGKGSKT